MSPKSVLITGCNRGIGLELVKQYLKCADHVFATCRDPAKAEELNAVAAASQGKVHVHKLDVTDYSAFDSIKNVVEATVGENGLNLLINNAGFRPYDETAEEMRKGFEINCVAPYFFSKAMLPLVKKSAEKNAALSVGVDRGAIIMMSTAMASIADNSGGGSLAYRCSKVALNMAMKNLSHELKEANILVMAMHPGWVKTEMGGEGALITTEECCTTMVKTLAGLTGEDQAVFKRYNNTDIPW